MDSYTEQIVEAKTPQKSSFYSALGTAFIVLGVFLMMFIHMLLGLLALILGGVFCFLGNRIKNIEYEYLFVNGDCDIAMIKNKASRKNVFSFAEGDVQRIMPYTSPRCKNELETNRRLEKKDYTSGNSKKQENWYVYIVNNKKNNVAVILELNEKNINNTKSVFKSKFEDY